MSDTGPLEDGGPIPAVHPNEDPFPTIWDDDAPEDAENLGDDSDPIVEETK